MPFIMSSGQGPPNPKGVPHTLSSEPLTRLSPTGPNGRRVTCHAKGARALEGPRRALQLVSAPAGGPPAQLRAELTPPLNRYRTPKGCAWLFVTSINFREGYVARIISKSQSDFESSN